MRRAIVICSTSIAVAWSPCNAQDQDAIGLGAFIASAEKAAKIEVEGKLGPLARISKSDGSISAETKSDPMIKSLARIIAGHAWRQCDFVAGQFGAATIVKLTAVQADGSRVSLVMVNDQLFSAREHLGWEVSPDDRGEDIAIELTNLIHDHPDLWKLR